jgi:hypothetical protein
MNSLKTRSNQRSVKNHVNVSLSPEKVVNIVMKLSVQ